MPATITTTELAETIGTTPRTLRKFLRAQEMGVGKGSRYALPATKRDIAALSKKFAAWHEAQEAAREARREAQEAPEAEIIDAPADDFDSLEHPLDA